MRPHDSRGWFDPQGLSRHRRLDGHDAAGSVPPHGWLRRLQRIAEPHDHGIIRGVGRLFFYQPGGGSRSGKLLGWRLGDLSRMSDAGARRSSFAASLHCSSLGRDDAPIFSPHAPRARMHWNRGPLHCSTMWPHITIGLLAFPRSELSANGGRHDELPDTWVVDQSCRHPIHRKLGGVRIWYSAHRNLRIQRDASEEQIRGLTQRRLIRCDRDD